MFPREFDYVAPSSLEDALAALDDNPGAKVMSGGMSLLPLMKLRADLTGHGGGHRRHRRLGRNHRQRRVAFHRGLGDTRRCGR